MVSFKKIAATILISAAAFVVGMIAYDAYKRWADRRAAAKASRAASANASA